MKETHDVNSEYNKIILSITSNWHLGYSAIAKVRLKSSTIFIPSTWDVGLAGASDNSTLSLVQDFLSHVFCFLVCSIQLCTHAWVQLVVPEYLVIWVMSCPSLSVAEHSSRREFWGAHSPHWLLWCLFWMITQDCIVRMALILDFSATSWAQDELKALGYARFIDTLWP